MEVAYPDTLVGTDSHTTMVNGLSVLGWGVGGIEAEAAMLGQPYSMLLPEVIGVKFTGKLKEGVTATDLVLTVTQMLRKRGVVGKFVEFFGPGLASLTIADRATIGNMSPEYGATCGFFPIDDDTINYLRDTGRSAERVALVAAYAKAQGMYRTKTTPDPIFTDVLKLELVAGRAVARRTEAPAGPRRAQGGEARLRRRDGQGVRQGRRGRQARAGRGRNHDLGHGDVVIAAITSCTNTSNPSVMIGAGLLARKAVAKGLTVKPWVKTSLAPGSQVVGEYLEKSGLQKDLDKLGFNLVGFGCTTCIGNSGPLAPEISKAINDQDLVAAAVLSGNRNFEGRVNPDVRANYLASPPLVVAYALAGSMYFDLVRQPLGLDKKGKKVFLKDIWPTSREINGMIRKTINKQMFAKKYADVFKGDAHWRKISVKGGLTYALGQEIDLRAEPALFRRHGRAPGAAHRHRRRARAGAVARFHHHRPHLAGRLDQARFAGRQVSDRPQGQADRLQPVRHAARQSRSDDARHLRQHPPQEPDGAGRRGRRDHPLSLAPAHVDLRRGHALQAGEGSARGLRRQGIRLRLLARLGRQGRQPARRPRRDLPVVRAHPPLQPDRHGRAPAVFRGRHVLADARASRATSR